MKKIIMGIVLAWSVLQTAFLLFWVGSWFFFGLDYWVQMRKVSLGVTTFAMPMLIIFILLSFGEE